MLDHINIKNVLFLDIETVPRYPNYTDAPEGLQELWAKKTKYEREEHQTPEDYFAERAGIIAEFGKIICISIGFSASGKLRLKSFYGDDEKELLYNFIEMMDQHYSQSKYMLCAHNGKEFDFPYIARRALINGLRLPKILDIAGKKPWEINHLDTMELWKFGDYKNYTSIALLANVFGIPTPKDDINGSDVARVYWKDKDLDRIVIYCQKDVVTVAQLLLRYKGMPLILEEDIIIPN
ncbi:MAG: 3'-5' exonuclease [Flavobacteriales bacterium]|nr:3'-5' exonuclease [Flavobacteriales bacterium]